MRETITLKGLVLRTTRVKENDKFLDVLTDKLGRISVYSHGTRSYRNKNSAASEMFRYSEMTVEKTGVGYTLKESDEIYGFYAIMSDLADLALAQYICDLLCETAQEEVPEDDLLRTALNALYAVSETDIERGAVKAVCELRFAVQAGFMPDLTGCRKCGKPFCETAGSWLLDISEGGIICPDCADLLDPESLYYEEGTPKPFAALPSASVAAMRYIISSDPKRCFSFRLEGIPMNALCSACEKYILYHLDRRFTTLDFYRSCSG